MASVTEILDSEAGPYEWGERDCLTTAGALVAGLSGEKFRPDYSKWHALPELEAMAKAKREFGSVAEAHASGFINYDNIVIIDASNDQSLIKPGDIIQLRGTVMGWGGTFNTAKTGDLLGFIDASYTILHWYSLGLRPVDGYQNIVKIFRCQ